MNNEQKRESGQEGSHFVKNGQALIAKIVQHPETGTPMVLIQLEGNDEHAWIADGSHFAGIIVNPAGVRINQAIKTNSEQRIITPDNAGKIIRP